MQNNKTNDFEEDKGHEQFQGVKQAEETDNSQLDVFFQDKKEDQLLIGRKKKKILSTSLDYIKLISMRDSHSMRSSSFTSFSPISLFERSRSLLSLPESYVILLYDIMLETIQKLLNEVCTNIKIYYVCLEKEKIENFE